MTYHSIERSQPLGEKMLSRGSEKRSEGGRLGTQQRGEKKTSVRPLPASADQPAFSALDQEKKGQTEWDEVPIARGF